MNISISGIADVVSMARQIKRYPAAVEMAGKSAVKATARTVVTAAPRDISQRYNYPASYARGNFSITFSASGDSAVVSARRRGVRLARFDANQLTSAAARAKGDRSRKIAPGRKQAGVSVNVLRGGSRKAIRKGFFIPLRAGKAGGGNGQGLFLREPDGSLKHLYGVSPHQAYRAWLVKHQKDISEMLAKLWSAHLSAALRKAK